MEPHIFAASLTGLIVLGALGFFQARTRKVVLLVLVLGMIVGQWGL